MTTWCKHVLAVCGCWLMLSGLVQADVLQLKQDYPERYVVQKGDTLWDISGRFLQNPWQWPEIWNYNQQIKNPHLIFPGDELTLVWIDGRPQLVVNRGKTASTIKLSPYVRKTPIDNAITTIPFESIRPFLEAYRFEDEDTLDDAPYIISAAEGALLMGKGSKLYAKGRFDDAVKNYGVYRIGNKFKHPRTKKKLGLQIRKIGDVSLIDRHDEIGTFVAGTATSGFLQGDVLLPADEDNVRAFFQPRPVRSDIDAYIMDVVSGVQNVGRYDVVLVDVGSQDGIEPGSVFGVLKSGGVVKDPNKSRKSIELPDEVAGNIMIFKAFESISYGLVMRTSMPLSVGDKLSAP